MTCFVLSVMALPAAVLALSAYLYRIGFYDEYHP